MSVPTNKAVRAKIRDFLKKFKKSAKDNGIYFVSRKKNMDTIIALGITIDEAIEKIMTISTGDYSSGPLKDHQSDEGEIWIFSKKVNELNIYIKLRFCETSEWGKQAAAVLSFHEPKYNIFLPHRSTKK